MAGFVGGGPPTMGQDMPFSPYDGPIRPHPGTRRPMTPTGVPQNLHFHNRGRDLRLRVHTKSGT